MQVVISAPVSEISAPAVEGHLSAKEALTALLEASGLVYTVVGNTVSIRAATIHYEPRTASQQ
jgi:hypothetical protein